jgi:hypothetical protein
MTSYLCFTIDFYKDYNPLAFWPFVSIYLPNFLIIIPHILIFRIGQLCWELFFKMRVSIDYLLNHNLVYYWLNLC